MSTLAAFTRPVAVAALFAAPAAASAAPFMPDAQVTYLTIGQAPTIGTSGPLADGNGVEKELPGFTAHLVPGGTYDPDGPAGPAEACTLGFGFAVAQ